MLTDFKGREYAGGLRRFTGANYAGKITDSRGNLIETGGISEITIPLNIAGYWKDNYSGAYRWLESQAGLVRGIIVTDTHYGAGENRFTNSQAIRTAVGIQKALSDVLFFHLGDIRDDGPLTFEKFIEDGAKEVTDRSIYITGNHEHQNISASECSDVRAELVGFMDGITVVNENNMVFYKDYAGIRFIAINQYQYAYLNQVITAFGAPGDVQQYVVLSHQTPRVTEDWSNMVLTGNVGLYTELANHKDKLVGHWTGHNHWDAYEYYKDVHLTTFACDYCRKTYSWHSPNSITEGALTCFAIDKENKKVTFQRFGAAMDRFGNTDMLNGFSYRYG